MNLFLEALHVVSYAKLNLLEVIVAASRACMQNPAKSQFFSKGQRAQKVTTHFCPRVFRLKTLPRPPTMPSESARSAR